MRTSVTTVIVFLLGFAVAQFFELWREKLVQRTVPPRQYALVMKDVSHALPQLVGAGVYWFDGSLEDARQIKDVIEVLQPSLSVSVMKVEGLRDVAVINTQHSIFENGGMLLREVEKKLLQLSHEG